MYVFGFVVEIEMVYFKNLVGRLERLAVAS
jgi:hypothetical protein